MLGGRLFVYDCCHFLWSEYGTATATRIHGYRTRKFLATVARCSSNPSRWEWTGETEDTQKYAAPNSGSLCRPLQDHHLSGNLLRQFSLRNGLFFRPGYHDGGSRNIVRQRSESDTPTSTRLTPNRLPSTIVSRSRSGPATNNFSFYLAHFIATLFNVAEVKSSRISPDDVPTAR